MATNRHATSQYESKQNEFPRVLGENVETLVYLGYSQSRAEEVAALATRVRREFPETGDTWLNIAIDNAVHPSVPDMGPETENWWPLFQQLGLSEQLYGTIMHPGLSQIRKARTAKFWIRDTMEFRYGRLSMIRGCSQERRARIQAPSVEFQSSQGSERPRGQQSSSRVEPASPQSLTPIAATAEPDEPVPEGYIALWKGIARSCIEYQDNGRILLRSLHTLPPSDFAGPVTDGPTFYFAEDRAFGVKYAKYAKVRVEQSQLQVNNEDVVLLRLLVKKSWAEGIRQFVDGDDWKKVVFLSRNGKPLHDKNGQELGVARYAGAKLLIGRIAECVERSYEAMGSWPDIAAPRLEAIQWCFKGDHQQRQAFVTAAPSISPSLVNKSFAHCETSQRPFINIPVDYLLSEPFALRQVLLLSIQHTKSPSAGDPSIDFDAFTFGM
ncbi:hypothetical protein F5B21DRAFT_503966 [Xylaria acuta]|nr:hypothetical protein F5B21DRAFT_503966 [Xylaria acuta]